MADEPKAIRLLESPFLFEKLSIWYVPPLSVVRVAVTTPLVVPLGEALVGIRYRDLIEVEVEHKPGPRDKEMILGRVLPTIAEKTRIPTTDATFIDPTTGHYREAIDHFLPAIYLLTYCAYHGLKPRQDQQEEAEHWLFPHKYISNLHCAAYEVGTLLISLMDVAPRHGAACGSDNPAR
ncbi:MAG: hypothetical protein HONBIEJF_02870 [Fimbriimonadaceae bacterium]|nr:hypothetical protein [Fimbriimonadaceae bacterium]